MAGIGDYYNREQQAINGATAPPPAAAPLVHSSQVPANMQETTLQAARRTVNALPQQTIVFSSPAQHLKFIHTYGYDPVVSGVSGVGGPTSTGGNVARSVQQTGNAALQAVKRTGR